MRRGVFTMERARVAELRVKLGHGHGCEPPHCVDTTLPAGERKRVKLEALPMLEVPVVGDDGAPVVGTLLMALPRFAEGSDPRMEVEYIYPRPVVSTTGPDGRAAVNIESLSEEECSLTYVSRRETCTCSQPRRALHYPTEVAKILGAWKVLGVVALLVPLGTPRLKEWAHAGFCFDLSRAFFSHLAVGDPVANLAPPLVLLVVMFASWRTAPAGRTLGG